MTATVVALVASTAARVPLRSLQTARALENRGIEGDRHALKGNRRSVLLMAQETLDTLKLQPGDVREQVTVRGLDLDAVPLGARLRVGSAVLEMGAQCAPCERMEELRPGLERALDGRRGRFVRVVVEGEFAVGDRLTVEPPA